MNDLTPNGGFVQLPLFPETPSKACTKCGIVYPLSDQYWSKEKRNRDGYKSWCKPCRRITISQHRALHPDQRKNTDRQYRENHKVKRQRQRRQHYLKNRGVERTTNQVWRATHSHQASQIARRRRARKANAEGTFTEAEVQQLYADQGGKCFHCSAELGDDFHRDHWIPLSRGGSDWISNIRLLCQPCNNSKYNKLPHEWDSRYSE